MKKLLYTTAIAGAVMSTVAAHAETKVTGNLALSIISSKDDKTSPVSFTGFGKESQINISNSGDLSNGMKYAAGFSLEMDGGDHGVTTGDNVTVAKLQGQQSENVYIDFISGNTTISVGADHFQNTDAHLTNIVGFGYINADGASQSAGSIYPSNQATNYGAYGVGIMQKTDIGTFGVNYTPNNVAGMAGNDILNGVKRTQVDNAESATEVNFKGDFGVKGLTVLAGQKFQKTNGSTSSDQNGRRVAASYKTGAVTVAVDHATFENGNSIDQTGKSVGVGFAVSDSTSIGAFYAKADKDGSAATEKTTGVAIGYSLGAVSIQTQYKSVSDLGGTAGQDGTQLAVYLSTKF
jgi:hypothetical protein